MRSSLINIHASLPQCKTLPSASRSVPERLSPRPRRHENCSRKSTESAQRGSLNLPVDRDVHASEVLLRMRNMAEHHCCCLLYKYVYYWVEVVKSDASVYIWSVSVTKNDLDTLVMCVYFNEINLQKLQTKNKQTKKQFFLEQRRKENWLFVNVDYLAFEWTQEPSWL